MPRRIRVRELSADEQQAVGKLARSRTAAVRQVERARIIQASSEGKAVADIAGELGVRQDKVRRWIKRFNERGLAGLEDEQRSGRPATYSPEEVREVVATALTDPQRLGLPFAKPSLCLGQKPSSSSSSPAWCCHPA